MIEFRDLVDKPLPPQKQPPPVFGSERAEAVLRGNIEDVIKSIYRPFRFGQAGLWKWNLLFSMVGGEEVATVRGAGNYGAKYVGRIEPNEGHRVLLAVMSSYGFDQSVSKPFGSGTVFVPDSELGLGLSHELLNFPSQTIPGLVFQQQRLYIRATNETFQVNWMAIDAAPQFQLNLRRTHPKFNRPAFAANE